MPRIPIIQKEKKPRYPPTDEWIKLWYIYTMEYYSVIKMITIVVINIVK